MILLFSPSTNDEYELMIMICYDYGCRHRTSGIRCTSSLPYNSRTRTAKDHLVYKLYIGGVTQHYIRRSKYTTIYVKTTLRVLLDEVINALSSLLDDVQCFRHVRIK